MKKYKDPSKDAAKQRRRAEAQPPPVEMDMQRLVHQLQIHRLS